LLTPRLRSTRPVEYSPELKARHRRDDEHALDDRAHPVRAHPLEDRHERADARLEVAGRQDRDEQQDRAAVEDGDAEDDRVDRLGHLGLRVLHLSGGHADHLDGGIGEDHARHDEDRPVPVEVTARRPESARVAPKVVEAGLVAADVEAADDEDEAHDEEDDDGADLGDGRPELELAERPGRQQVDDEDHGERDEDGGPCRHERKPVLHVETHRGQLGDAGQRPVKPVHPAGDVGGLLAVELPHVGHEGARRGPVQHELAEGAHEQVGDDADERIAEQQGRTGAVQTRGRAEEQPGADGATDGDHLHMPAGQCLLVAHLLSVERVLRLAGFAGGPGFGLRH